VVIGDVCGKGTPASLFMAVVVTVLRAAAREEADAASTIERANNLLCRDNAASMFATAFFGVLDLRSGTLEYCNCGHNAPVHILASGEFRRLAATGLPLALYEDRPAEVSKIRLDPGDSLVLFTDGVTEAVNLSQEEFGETLLLETLLGSHQCTMSELVSRLFDVVDAFAQEQEQADDITCVAIRRR
jgi:sigma-B regulation protein RsbU (phosphoserine phosphatase)